MVGLSEENRRKQSTGLSSSFLRALARSSKKHPRLSSSCSLYSYPKALRSYIFRILGPKTILYKVFGLRALGLSRETVEFGLLFRVVAEAS